jgi:hypothetical protein
MQSFNLNDDFGLYNIPSELSADLTPAMGSGSEHIVPQLSMYRPLPSLPASEGALQGYQPQQFTAQTNV